MSANDQNETRTTEVRTTYETAPPVTEVRRVEVRSSNAGWWVAMAVAVVAVAAVGFVLVNQPSTPPTADQLTSASQQGRTQGFVEGAQAAGQVNAQAAQSSQLAAQNEADRAAANRQAAEAAASRAANASDAGRDASDSGRAQPANPPPSN